LGNEKGGEGNGERNEKNGRGREMEKEMRALRRYMWLVTEN